MRVRSHRALAILAFASSLSIAMIPSHPASAARLPALSFEGGVSSTNLEPSPYFETHSLLGGTGGIALDIHLTDRLSIEPEVLWVRRGARLGDAELLDTSGNRIGTVRETITADFTDVPVLARFEPPTTNPLKPFALVGPRLGFKSAERVELRGALSSTTDTSRMESFELGAIAGGGLEYGTGHHRVVLDMRYDAGLTRHDDGAGGRFRTNAVLIMAGYVFHPGD